MKPFEYITPATLDEALAILREDDGARVLAGGIDLLGAMKRGVSAPERLLNLKSIQALDGIRQEPDGSLTIGALTKLSAIAVHPVVAQQYPLLTQAVRQTATPQVRNTGTLGGNLCQRPRCMHYRHPDFSCVRKLGEGCFAVRSQDRYHAIFGGDRCFMVHPSDTAPALIALDAQVVIVQADGSRTIPLGAFFVGPGESLTRENVLTPHEILTEIRLPPPPEGARGVYLKVAERKTTDFALAGVALHLAWNGPRVSHARIVLGGVAPVPWRVPQAEALLLDETLSDDRIRRSCEAAVEGARPIGRNDYKIPLVKGLIRKGLRQLRD